MSIPSTLADGSCSVIKSTPNWPINHSLWLPWSVLTKFPLDQSYTYLVRRPYCGQLCTEFDSAHIGESHYPNVFHFHTFDWGEVFLLVLLLFDTSFHFSAHTNCLNEISSPVISRTTFRLLICSLFDCWILKIQIACIGEEHNPSLVEDCERLGHYFTWERSTSKVQQRTWETFECRLNQKVCKLSFAKEISLEKFLTRICITWITAIYTGLYIIAVLIRCQIIYLEYCVLCCGWVLLNRRKWNRRGCN